MTTPPPCSCGDPAATQIHVGTRLTDHGPVRHYAWACEACAAEAEREREASIRG